MRKIILAMQDSRFCLARSGGQGYVSKSECTCSRDCQAIKDSSEFYRQYSAVLGMGKFTRYEIINEHISKDIKESQWYKDNVI